MKHFVLSHCAQRLPDAALATHAGKTSATTARSAVIERTPPCWETPAPVGQHLPITPVLGSGNHNLGWGIAAPSAISNDGDGTSWVACINWSGWGDVQSYGTGWAEIYGPQNTRPIVGVELRASKLGRCGSSHREAYISLNIREPSRAGGKPGAWIPWSGDGHVCYPNG